MSYQYEVADRFRVVRLGEGSTTRSGVQIECSGCGVTSTVQQNNHRHWNMRSLEAHWTKHGWTVGNKSSKDKCPDCTRPRRSNVSELPKNVTALPVAAPSPSQQSPREMTRMDRRAIFVKLEECYGTEQTGYNGDWTDDKVAIDLGVPKAWVAAVRDENFGPASDNAEIRRVLAEAKVLLTQANVLKSEMERYATTVDRMKGDLAKLLSNSERIANAIVRIEKGVGR